ncbi:Oidioi.mRNA.OKI2018_I69.PAR.g9098.t1.cds [Oikopleura dioica]|uniref:Oidioi.mRNA.OKI2018_I69.PAR.g9098.t1.cds n=1 Tax=Oikopleura dioica TaxID=34765 RepID=A0ABN7RN71_OIKDI|nr:Oidioi.mRNA.OKI2018_I69.PAR.g9098.t1.cds [Oikopleura dioica]
MCINCKGTPFQTKFGRCKLQYSNLGKTVVPGLGIVSVLAISEIGSRVVHTFYDTGFLEEAFLKNGALTTAQADAILNLMNEDHDQEVEKLAINLARAELKRKLEVPKKIKLSSKPKKPLTDEELIKLFGEADEPSAQAPQKKRAKKINKKKPNQGKAPNAIRKTKKPARL